MAKRVLRGILEDLGNEEFDHFKWLLKDESFLLHFPAISKAALGNVTSRFELVDVMIGTYNQDATEVCKMILSDINRRDLLEKLSKATSEPAGASGVNPASAATGDGQHSVDTDRVGHGGSQTSRSALKKYFHKLILDINSAHGFLQLSRGNRSAACCPEVIQPYPVHPDRFDIWCQVLTSGVPSTRCYWEVEWSGEVLIAVAYRGTTRKGGANDLVFGENAQSWSLWCSADGLSVRHNKTKSILPYSSPSSGRVAVYLDHFGGSLSFYNVSSGDLVHLYTYSTTFTQPLHAGFWLGPRSSVSLCDV